MPQKAAGIRIEPAPSLPWCKGPNPAAAAAPAPAEDAPAFMPCFHGLCVMPVSGLSDTPFQPNSEVVVLPSTMPPSAWRRGTTGVSSVGWKPFAVRLPLWVGMSLVQARSLIVTGTPCRRPMRSPPMRAFSAARAASMARSAARCAKALTFGSSTAMRSSRARIASTGDICFVRIFSAHSVAGR